MIKRIAIASTWFFLLTCLVAAAVWAADGNARKGKHLFRTTCRQCHQDGATAPALNPDSKTQAQWEKAFKPETWQAFTCKDEWAKLTAEDLTDIFTYLYEHAYDSPSPAKCK